MLPPTLKLDATYAGGYGVLIDPGKANYAMLDPRTAHYIDARHLLAHVQGMEPTDLPQVRCEFARFLTSQHRADYTTWQAAWNAFTGAAPRQPGTLRYRTARCPECHGRRFSARNVARNLSRTGNPHACYECRGSGRGKLVTKTALYIQPPTEPAQPQDPPA